MTADQTTAQPAGRSGRVPSNPGPVETPGSNDHRVGAPNHLEGSGENSMVGARPCTEAALFDLAYELNATRTTDDDMKRGA